MSKLYVVGEASADPTTWSIWSEYALVIADSPEQAQELADRRAEPVAEIPMDKPLYLVGMTEPNWGADI